MKVLIVNHYAIPPVESGGTRHYSLAKELIKRGHQVRIIAANFSHQNRIPIVSGVNERVFERSYDELPFVWVKVPAYRSNSPARAKNMITFAKVLLTDTYFRDMEPPDIVIGSSPHPFAAWAAQKMAVRWGVPFLFEVRDLWPQSLIDLGRISPRHPAIRLLAKLEKYLYNRADKIITLLPGAHTYIQSVGIDSNKIIWLPNGIDFNIFRENRQKVDNQQFTVMYAGNHGLGNGLNVIVDCAEVLKNVGESNILFRLIGDGPQKESLKKIVAIKQLTNVQLDEPVPKRQIPGVLSQADAFILLLRDSPVFRWGISPNKLYDYLCSCRPVIFGVNAINNPVEEAGAGITVPPENPEALAKAVLELYHMKPADRKQMGLNGKKYVEENHDFRKLAVRLEEVLLEATAEFNATR